MGNLNLNTIELYEEFKVLLLNRANEVLGIHILSKGGISGTMVDLKLLFAVVLKSASSSIILAHNHPSGNLKPSEADKMLHNKIKKAANYLDVNVLDNEGWTALMELHFLKTICNLLEESNLRCKSISNHKFDLSY